MSHDSRSLGGEPPPQCSRVATLLSGHGARSEGSGREGEAATGHDRDDLGARSRAGRSAREGEGVRRLPHRSPLSGGWHQRRLPLPPRPRGRGSRRISRRRRHEREPRRQRRHRVAGSVRHLSLVREGAPVVLLRLRERHAEDDPRRGRSLACTRHRCLRREDARRGDAVCADRSERAARSRRASSDAA